MNENISQAGSYVGYEYNNVSAQKGMVSVYTDGYTNFGWELDSTSEPIAGAGSMNLRFKRDRKIRNKAELTRLQRQFESCTAEIARLERSKNMEAMAISLLIGIVGTAFMALSVFAYLAGLMGLSILLAVPGFAGWVLPYFFYLRILKSKTEKVTPLIDQKYDEIYTICEKANGLLNRSAY